MNENFDDDRIVSESSSSSSLLSLLTSSISISSQAPPVPPPSTPVSLSSSSSFSSQMNIQPTIPIFQLNHSTSDTIQNLNQNNLNEQMNDNSMNEWSNSLVKPASRISIMSRRECKSTSDEPYTHELNGQNSNVNYSQNTSVNNNLLSIKPNQVVSKQTKLDLIRDELLLSTNLKTKINGGQFGYNPLKFNSNLTKFLMPNNNHKSIKRLTNSHNKYFIDNLKKYTEYNHHKKLFQAVSNNDYDLVAELLDSAMYDVNCFDDKQRTCLHIACSRGHLDIVRLLLKYGANPNIRDCVSNLPIHLAIISSHVPIVTLLLEAGTDIHSLDMNGKTVLHLAGTRLRWLLSDENHKASPKLKFEAIIIMNMIKEYLRRKKTPNTDLDILANQIENSFNLEDINNLTKEFLNQFEAFSLSQTTSSETSDQSSANNMNFFLK